MSLTSARRLRDACWESLGPAVRRRLEELAGPLIEWWATDDDSAGDGRPKATVLGRHGLYVAEPRLNTEHRPVYRITGYEFDQTTLRHVTVDHRPQAAPYPGSAAGPTSSAGPDLGLSADACGILGNLPPKAQELLQAPFLAGQRVLRCDWHYEGFEHRLTMFMLYLAGARDVTAAGGTRLVPAGHSEATAHWSLSIHRAGVVRRIGK
jgi:hypothetical protein